MSSNRLPATPRLIDGLVRRGIVRRTDRTSDRRRTMPRLASGGTPYRRRRNQTALAGMNQQVAGTWSSRMQVFGVGLNDLVSLIPIMNRSIMTQRRLLVFKWLMVFVPVGTVTLGHSLLEHNGGRTHALPTLAVTLPVSVVGLLLTYIFVETLFRVLRRLQAEAVVREQDIQTMTAVMQERERLSRELHDGVAQLVADLLLRLDTIKELVEAGRPHEAEAELEHLHGVADEIYQDIGESITGLRTNLTERGLVRALQDYVDQFEERHQIATNLRADEAAEQIAPLAALQLFRLIQEALTNVRKHAAAHHATVTLMSDGSGQLKVIIADDGQGFLPGAQSNSKARSLGLTSMRERVEALGGTFQVTSQPTLGTQVTVTVPIPRTRRENTHAALAPPPGR